MGFSTPIEKWFSRDGEYRQTLETRLLGTNSRLTEFFNPHALELLLRQKATQPLWLLLFLEEWLEQNA
jgi:hypothetical protein